jgi:hypothetical protein
MNRDEALKWVLSRSQNITEAKEGWAWVQQFINEDTTKKERDRDQLDFPFGDPVKRTRKNSDAKRNGHKISPEELEYVTRKLPTIKTVEDFNAIANELDRSPGAISEWVSRAYVKIDHLRLPPAVFPKLYRNALKAAKEKGEANG